jgi:pimeloyl-ACP methyl ester carboxylesterase
MFLTFQDGKIHYTDSGKGSVIVLLHGYLESAEVWNNFANKLASGFRVIAIDLPGHGLSGSCSWINSMEYLASAVRAVLDNAGVNKIFLIGHSMGGYVALAFLELFPGYLAGYTLFHSHPFKDMPETLEKRKLNIEIVEDGKKEEMIPGFIRGLFAPQNPDKLGEAMGRSADIASGTEEKTIIADLKGMMARPDRRYLVESGQIPFLWIFGKMDIHIDYREMQKKVRIHENGRITVLENSGHMGFIEEEDKSLEVITQFVSDVFKGQKQKQQHKNEFPGLPSSEDAGQV